MDAQVTGPVTALTPSSLLPSSPHSVDPSMPHQGLTGDQDVECNEDFDNSVEVQGTIPRGDGLVVVESGVFILIISGS